MLDFQSIHDEYLEDIVKFLNSVKWIFNVLNTQYIIEDVLGKNRKFIAASSNDLPDLSDSISQCPESLQKLIEDVNRFKIVYDTINTESWKSPPIKKMSVKKQYEIENFSKVIHEVCNGKTSQLVDFGSGLGYLDLYLNEKFGYKVLGLEGAADRVQKAIERLEKLQPQSKGAVEYRQHFITLDSEEFILSQFEDLSSLLTIFGLHGCGDLTVTAIKLFLNIERVKSLIFMPCCFHKMSAKVENSNEFNFFPLSDELASILEKYPHATEFLNRPFLRLAGQESPSKCKEMSESDHWIHGKNMFERAMAEALLTDDETIKRINKITFPENRVTFNDITLKYNLINNLSGKSKPWSEYHQQKFKELRDRYPDGEEMSEKLFCLQTTLQNSCENLVLIDRLRHLEEQGKLRNLKLKISVKKLQNDNLSPRCLILIVEKL